MSSVRQSAGGGRALAGGGPAQKHLVARGMGFPAGCSQLLAPSQDRGGLTAGLLSDLVKVSGGKMILRMVLMLALSHAAVGRADVHYIEEVSSFAVGQTKPQKTVNKVYIKGKRQKVHRRIEADKKMAQTLEKQGQLLDSSTILRLDQAQVYKIDHLARTYVQEKLPAAKPVAAKSASNINPYEPVIKFRVKPMPDTTRIEGILCHRVAADMRARYYQPNSNKIQRENRYLYQAWVAKDFPGYQDIQKFREAQARETSYPSLIGGGLEQLRDRIEDYERLVDEMKALEGFSMQSVLKVYVKPSGKEEKQVYQLTRTVKSLSYSPLPDAVFQTSKNLKKLE